MADAGVIVPERRPSAVEVGEAMRDYADDSVAELLDQLPVALLAVAFVALLVAFAVRYERRRRRRASHGLKAKDPKRPLPPTDPF